MIITLMLMGIFIMGLYNINMINKKKEQAEILMEIPEEMLQELVEEEEPEEEDPLEDRKLLASERTHKAFNEDFESHDDFEERLKSLTESPETETEDSPEEEVEDAIETQKPLEKVEEEVKPNSSYSSSSWSLKGRKLMGKIPNPVYTCNGSGKVVVKIEVNSNGYVVDTKIDKRKSSTRNECLFDNAMAYAREALFSKSSIEEQEGTITYFFNYSE
ncbi:hypothetical protein [Aquimarina brevivitae]|uniref:hypothetical protein n=1 Tax=Aquimarina brevivitae TaxID=323412 RepID=UPI0013EE51AF|nr:hypothetical protein [Aquimarina brevivitae]